MAIDFTHLSRAEARERAEHWLSKAIQMEAEGKSEGLVNKALNIACEAENAATDGRS